MLKAKGLKNIHPLYESPNICSQWRVATMSIFEWLDASDH